MKIFKQENSNSDESNQFLRQCDHHFAQVDQDSPNEAMHFRVLHERIVKWVRIFYYVSEIKNLNLENFTSPPERILQTDNFINKRACFGNKYGKTSENHRRMERNFKRIFVRIPKMSSGIYEMCP